MSSFVVIDLEMCRVNHSVKNLPYPHKNEIIQIGAVLLDESYEIKDRFMTYVSPEYGSVDLYIQNLTGISRQNTDSAPRLAAALEAFSDWIPDDSILITWSENDTKQLLCEMDSKGLSFEKLDKIFAEYVDCQIIFGEKMNNPQKQYSLAEALPLADIEYEDGAHDALVDAYNTALLYTKLQKEQTLMLNKYYRCENEEEHLSFNPFADLFNNMAIA